MSETAATDRTAVISTASQLILVYQSEVSIFLKVIELVGGVLSDLMFGKRTLEKVIIEYCTEHFLRVQQSCLSYQLITYKRCWFTIDAIKFKWNYN